MVDQLRGIRRLAVGMAGFLGAMSLSTMPASAGLLTTDVTLADFSFVGGEVDYNPDPKTYARSARRDLEFSVGDPDLGFGDFGSRQDSLRGSLHIDAKTDNYGHFPGAKFNLFGSLPAISRLPEPELAADTVRAMRSDSKPGGLDFLIDRDRMVGPLTSRYRSVGIFTVVAGVDDSTWVQGFADGVSTMQLLEAEDGIAPPAANPAIPSPATLGLLAMGLALLPRRRTPSRGSAQRNH